MKFHQLWINNFLTIKTGTVFLDNRGLNVIQGVNEDDGSATSNGAGKSSVVDALCWVLYGVTARGVKGDAVVNLTAKKDCLVRVFLQADKHEYIITRHRKHKEHKNALHLHVRPVTEGPGCGPTDMTKGTDAETQKEVERVLGCSLDVFLAAVYAGQEMMPDLPRMTDRELKRLIEEAAGLERIERAYEEARTRRADVQSRLSVLSTQIDMVQNRILADEGRLELKKTEAQQFEQGRTQRIEQAQHTLNELSAQLADMVKGLQAEKPQLDSASRRIEELNAVMRDFAELEKKARTAETDAIRAEAAIDKALLADARRTVTTIESQIANVDAEMAEPCPECGKPHTEADRVNYIAHRTGRLANARENLKLVEAKVREQVLKVRDLKQSAAQLRAAVPDMSEANTERNRLEQTVKAHEARLAEAKVMRGHVDAAVSTLAMRRCEPNPASAVVASLEESLSSETAQLADLKTRHGALLRELEIADAVVKVFGPAGVRAQILDTVTPFLNERTADYLSALSDGSITACWSTLTRTAAGDLKEKFSIDVTNARGGDSFLSLSGGEKRKVRLATALALQDLVASRATQPIDLFVGDEVDDALDAAGLERLMVIMERRARERGTVILISHNSLSDWCDNVTVVRKSGGFSVVEGALCA